ncbi:sodium-coupled monocarboxylate transporter 1-like [Uloborus diversus]|uniref:sodium-coupled monocarboxylate transporter 1-like n=1 Tax=Uloborus diversus TaxID=327109 RepID=UPI0024094F16|nr:sodium-coupled monocarboxylate transporter 1-like [Uloborus diversus]
MDEVSPDKAKQRFDIADYAVCGAMLAVSVGIGVFYAIKGSKVNTTKEFLFGGKKMKVLPVALSILATFLSAITLLGVPAESYQFGLMYWMINISYCVMIPLSAHIYVPLFYKLQVSSVNEYLEKRYNKGVRLVCFIVSTISQLIYTAFVIYAPSLVFSQVTGLDLWVCVLSMGLVCTFYTTIGGIKAVIWTDVFQALIIYGALITVIVKGTIDVGGLHEVWRKADMSQRTQFIDFNPDPTVRHTIWSLTIGGLFTWLSIYAVNQAMIQRSLTIPTLARAKAVIWLNLPGNILTITLTIVAGLIIYANYSTCDPITTKQIKSPNQILPFFVMDSLSLFPGLRGLFVSGIFSGALSTMSSTLNSLSANTLEDLVKSYIATNMSELWATRTAKLLVDSCQTLYFNATKFMANITSAATPVISLNDDVFVLYRLSYLWYSGIGCIIVIVIGLLVSLFIEIENNLWVRKSCNKSLASIYLGWRVLETLSLLQQHIIIVRISATHLTWSDKVIKLVDAGIIWG